MRVPDVPVPGAALFALVHGQGAVPGLLLEDPQNLFGLVLFVVAAVAQAVFYPVHPIPQFGMVRLTGVIPVTGTSRTF